jgi:hypothetical protein
MEQRPLRLGDIVDDYCPRERRVTNHAIVAVVEDAIRQTRCTTCDAEHPYKGAKEPRLRKKPAAGELDDRVLADVAGPGGTTRAPEADDAPLSASGMTDGQATQPPPLAASDGSSDEATAAGADTRPEDSWPAHRQLIRATLPRTENDQPAPRPIPEFTMHQRPPSRGGRGFRFPGNGDGPARNGFPSGRPHHHSGRRHRGKKRSR